MRTTLIISDPIYERAKHLARKKKMPMPTLVTEAVEEFLLRTRAQTRAEQPAAIRLPFFSMGTPRLDIDNREELCRATEER